MAHREGGTVEDAQSEQARSLALAAISRVGERLTAAVAAGQLAADGAVGDPLAEVSDASELSALATRLDARLWSGALPRASAS